MQKTVKKMLFRGSFLIAILLHALFLLSVSFVLISQPNEMEKPHKLLVPNYVPSYMYTGTVSPPTPNKSAQKATAAKKTPSENLAVSHKAALSQPKQPEHEKSVLEMSRDVLQQDQFTREMERSKNAEPMLLIGEISQYADPLIKLVGRSLSANFRYPKMEGSFGVRGKVLVEMILHPEGYFSDVRIVETSNNDHFDSAALYAVNKAPKVVGADRLLSQPKYLVVGFIFN